MNLEDANKFIGRDADGLRKMCIDLGISIDWLAGKFSVFADEALKAREKQIADELEALLGTAYEARQTKLTHIIAQLRNGGKS